MVKHSVCWRYLLTDVTGKPRLLGLTTHRQHSVVVGGAIQFLTPLLVPRQGGTKIAPQKQLSVDAYETDNPLIIRRGYDHGESNKNVKE